MRDIQTLASRESILKLSLMAAKSRNGIIGSGLDIPWRAKGEQLLFKALTYNQWLLVGRKTFESMGVLPNRNYAVLTRSPLAQTSENVVAFSSIEEALRVLDGMTEHIIVAGGGEVYRRLIDKVHTLHISVVDVEAEGDVVFPNIPDAFNLVFKQKFKSNIDYSYQIWQRANEA